MYKNKRTQKQILVGGRVIGKGSYGCVVYPAIPCNKKQLQDKHNFLNKTVSKLIIDPKESGNEELIISKKIRQLDTKQKYFITYTDMCSIKTIPKERSNSVSGRYKYKTKYNYTNKSHSVKYFEPFDNYKKKDSVYCKLDLNLKPVNLIMPYGGYDLKDFLASKSQNTNLELTRLHITKQFKSCFYNLLQGLYLMHRSRIVNRDIKLDNIMIKYNDTTKKIEMKYIDFGLSTQLTKEFCSPQNNYNDVKKYDSSSTNDANDSNDANKFNNINVYSNVQYYGTESYISPEITILVFLIDNMEYDYEGKITYSQQTYKHIYNQLNTFNVKKLLSLKENKFANDIRKVFNEQVSKLSKLLSKPIEILNLYFGTPNNKYNGYLQKADIYALGITMYLLLEHYRYLFANMIKPLYPIIVKNNKQLHDLLSNMIQPDPVKRYNILDCINHSYFDDIRNSKV
jgi:serine/threonine protein kinase